MAGKKRRKARCGDRQKAIAIVRVSTSKQDIGASAQRRQLERWALQEGVELIAIYEDIGVSGAAPMAERPGLLAAVEALRSQGAGLLVAVKRDRFARHRHTIADVERATQRAGGVLVTTDGVCKGEDSEAEEVNATIQDLVAALELRKIKSRNKSRVQECKRRGCSHGGDFPYGYRAKRDGFRSARSGALVELEPVPLEQIVIDRMVELHKSGQSLRAIGSSLEDEGHLNRQGRPWKAMSVKRILDRATTP